MTSSGRTLSWSSKGKGRAAQGLCSWGVHFSSSLMEDASRRKFRALEKARSSAQLQANYSSSDNSLYTNPKGSTISAFDGGSDSSSESEPEEPQSRKKLRMEAS
uniref:MYC associated factor X n=1 Tax=Ornithorhynchus anatinus TaxID=9258 RepID=A0A6I8N5T5_ORNAN